jgi:FHS family glucose/mannose:H+ symporter-like MFS transporter
VASRLVLTGGRRAIVLTSFLAFVLLGAEHALYGPAFEAFQERYQQNATSVSLTVSLHFLGSFFTILASGVLIRRFGYPRLLAVSALLMTVAVGVIGSAPSWPVVLAGSFAAGLGFGVLDVGVNLLVIRSFAGRVGPVLNLLNAMFGLGAILGPALIAVTVPAVERAFLVVAALGLAITVLLWRLPQPSSEPLPGPATAASLGRAFAFVVIYFLYVSSEVGGASWETTHLTPHFGAVQAASFTSLYWMAVTVGRLLAAPVSAVVRPAVMVVGACVLALAAALLTQIVPVAPYAYVLLGLAFAPIFPSTLGWLHETFPARAEQIAPLALAGATLGPVVTSPLIGMSVAGFGPGAVPVALSLLTGALLVVSLLLYLRTTLTATNRSA